MRTLEERVQELEDIENIKKLKIRYAQACDNSYDTTALAPLFTEDAVWDGGELGMIFHGRDEILGFFKGVPETYRFALHYAIAPEIEVDPSGKEATGTWYLWMPATVRADANDRAMWMASTYNERYRKVEGAWKIAHLKLNLGFFTPFDTGWVKERVTT